MKPTETDLVPEAELVELFRRRRVDPAAFRARVALRIAEDRAGGPRGPASARVHVLRRAAALLPLDPSAGAGATGAAKLALAGIALPFVVLFGLLATFVAAGRSVRRSGAEARPAEEEPRVEVAAARSRGSLRASLTLTQLLQPLAMLALMLPSFTGARWAVDVVVAVVLLAAATLAFVVRGLADRALLTPRSVATCASAVLGATFVGLFLWPHARDAVGAGSDLGIGWSSGALIVGLAACALVPRARGARGTRGWLVLALALLFLNPLGCTFSTRSSVARQLAGLDLRAEDIARWEQAGAAAEALATTGAKDAPIDAPIGGIEREVARALRDGVECHPRTWTAASDAGVMTSERWARLAERPIERRKAETLLTLPIPLGMPEYDEYVVPMLLATRMLTAEERARLADRIDAGWPADDAFDPLSDALLRVRLFEHLGMRERVEARRADVHALLRSHWWPGSATSPFQVRGGFTPDPRKIPTSMPGTTQDAVALMTRFGVPEGIDVRAVRDCLRVESAAPWLVVPELPWLKLASRAALLRLESEIGLPPRSFLASLAAERAFVACVALVLLCLLAILSAPRPGPSSEADARAALP